LFLWFTSRCFGSFQLTDDIGSLRWFGTPGALLQRGGIIGLGLAACSYVGLVMFRLWRARWTRGLLAGVLADLDAQEAHWKEAWLQETRRANGATKLGRRSLSSVPTLLSSRSDASFRLSVDDVGKTPRSLSAPSQRLDFGLSQNAGAHEVSSARKHGADGMQVAVSSRGRVLEFALLTLRQAHGLVRRNDLGGARATSTSNARSPFEAMDSKAVSAEPPQSESGSLAVQIDSADSCADLATSAVFSSQGSPRTLSL